MQPIQPSSTVPERLRVLTMDGEMAYWADRPEYERLVQRGYGVPVGTKRRQDGEYQLHKVKLVRLIVPLPIATESGEVAGRILEPGSYAGQRYVAKRKTQSGHAYFEHRRAAGADRSSFLQVVLSATRS